MKRLRYVPLTGLLLALCACTLAPEPSSPAPVPSSPAAVPSSPTPQPTLPTPVPSSATPAAYPFTIDDLPTLDGSTANIPLASLVLQRLAGVPKAQADNVQFSGTSNAYFQLSCSYDEGPPNEVVLAYEPPEDTKKSIEKQSDCKKLEYHPIGRDALVFIANTKNPISGLTTTQYKNIYTGKITKWSQVGGTKQTIVAYQRPEDSGSQALMRKFVMGKTPMKSAPSNLISQLMNGMIKSAAAYQNSGNAIGYSVYYYAKDMYAAPGIKLLAANGVKPSSRTIADGSYPYVNNFYAVIRADEPKNSAARRVIAWLESAKGQKAVVAAGYVGKK